jgi:hypothetical protein
MTQQHEKQQHVERESKNSKPAGPVKNKERPHNASSTVARCSNESSAGGPEGGSIRFTGGCDHGSDTDSVDWNLARTVCANSGSVRRRLTALLSPTGLLVFHTQGCAGCLLVERPREEIKSLIEGPRASAETVAELKAEPAEDVGAERASGNSDAVDTAILTAADGDSINRETEVFN